MATSSIFTSFNISDRKTAEKFVSALDASAHDPERKPTAPVSAPVTDPEAIRKFFAERKKNQ